MLEHVPTLDGAHMNKPCLMKSQDCVLRKLTYMTHAYWHRLNTRMLKLRIQLGPWGAELRKGPHTVGLGKSFSRNVSMTLETTAPACLPGGRF